jgi:hypothetical protein
MQWHAGSHIRSIHLVQITPHFVENQSLCLVLRGLGVLMWEEALPALRGYGGSIALLFTGIA